MKNEKLMRAIGQIDEDLIIEARQTVRPRRTYVKWTALAASLALLVLVSPIALVGLMAAGSAKEAAPEQENAMVSDEAADESALYSSVQSLFDIIFNFNVSVQEDMETPHFEKSEISDGSTSETVTESETCYVIGQTVTNQKGSLEVTEMTESTIRLHLIKLTDEETLVKVNILCDSEGTVYNYGSYFPTDGVALWVNGERADKLPSLRGKYDILLDFSGLLSDPQLTLSDYIEVEGFGVFLRD